MTIFGGGLLARMVVSGTGTGSGSGINSLPRPVFITDPQPLFTNVGYQEGHSELSPTIKPGHGPQTSNRRMGKDDNQGMKGRKY